MFSRFFGSEIFRFPEKSPPYDIFIVFWGFGNFGPKNAQKNSETRGANSVARIPSSFSRGVYSFFEWQKLLSSADRVLAPKGVESRNPLFSSISPPQTISQPFSARKSRGPNSPLQRRQKSVPPIPFPQFPQPIEASQRKTVKKPRLTIRELKDKKRNNTQRKLLKQRKSETKPQKKKEKRSKNVKK